MKKKLYYTVEKGISSDGETLNGLKTVNVYQIVNNDIKAPFVIIDCDLEDNSKKKIEEFLDDNGYVDDEFELILL